MDVNVLVIFYPPKFLTNIWVVSLLLPRRLPVWTTMRLLLDPLDGRLYKQSDTWHNLPKLPKFLRSLIGSAAGYVLTQKLQW